MTARLPVGASTRRLRVGAASAGAWTTVTAVGTVLGGALVPVLAGATAVAAIGLAITARRPHRRRDTVGSGDERFWLALGTAVRDGLDAVGATRLGRATVTVTATTDGHRIAIDAGGTDATVWCAALTEMLGPVGTPRWLLHHLGAAPMVWRVPAIVGARRDDAEAFHAALVTTMPTVELLRGGTPESTAAIFGVPVHHPDVIEQTEHWR